MNDAFSMNGKSKSVDEKLNESLFISEVIGYSKDCWISYIQFLVEAFRFFWMIDDKIILVQSIQQDNVNKTVILIWFL